MSRPKLLDLFCGAGGAAEGYARAGFTVFGVDTNRERLKQYAHPHMLGDAIEYAIEYGHLYDAIHASPPCPRYSVATPEANRDSHPDLVRPIRELLQEWDGPYVIENVPGAPLENPITLCGSMFGLGVRRHRLFESNIPMWQPECDHASQPEVWGVYGDHGDKNPVTRPDGSSRGNKARDANHAGEVMGIDWMTEWDDLADAIPPSFTEHIGRQLITHISERAA